MLMEIYKYNYQLKLTPIEFLALMKANLSPSVIRVCNIGTVLKRYLHWSTETDS